ncbi:MAG: energy-coupling factor ABC transporter substrate-binding protein [Clostridium sp.]|uniref:energy-coupling factor ABC transporter substrate-binding protein n=1 Tax=Clostridium culturomicium TaxID=1499683 RepID=UPI00059109F6|nr:energy-coupling factor ABC transporter substrate-binding protein [Clostridium culturomicium]MDU4892124.1 energy-coupling factor ABC transporter substrate-binding protein [Clostridium sp.]MDU7082511.1 energy-coupling factor ABC transporter substrate-binding protein [Clostridium sp.]
MKLYQKNLLLLLLVIVIAAAPLLLLKNAEFGGADGLAMDAITEIDPDYEPWADSILEPKSGEIESLLFALQAAIGTGVVAFVLGRITAKKPQVKESK